MGQKKEHCDLIKEHFKKQGITQTWLAKKLDMSFSIPTLMFAIASKLILLPSLKWQIC